MRNIFKIRKIFLYKLTFNEMKNIECKLPINVEKINAENIPKVLNFRDINVKNSFNCMLNNGEIGIYGELDNKAVAHAWCIINNKNLIKNLEPFYKTKSKIAYIHFCSVKEDLKGNNIYPYLLYNLIKNVKITYDIDTFYIDTDADNIASQNGIKKLGFQLYHKYNFISILGITINKTFISK